MKLMGTLPSLPTPGHEPGAVPVEARGWGCNTLRAAVNGAPRGPLTHTGAGTLREVPPGRSTGLLGARRSLTAQQGDKRLTQNGG